MPNLPILFCIQRSLPLTMLYLVKSISENTEGSETDTRIHNSCFGQIQIGTRLEFWSIKIWYHSHLCDTTSSIRPAFSTEFRHIKSVPAMLCAWYSSIVDSYITCTDKYSIFYVRSVKNCVHLRNCCLTVVNLNFGRNH